MRRWTFIVGLAIAVSFALPSSAFAVAVHGVVRNIPYAIGFHPIRQSEHSYLGQLRLNFNNGIITGTYTDVSVNAGSPFANAHNIAVTGSISEQSHIAFNIGQTAFSGTMNGEKMSGSATIRGTIYVFSAHQGMQSK